MPSELVQPTSSAPESRQARRRRKTRDALYRAALSLFAEKGFEETTVVDITEAADTGKGTFFHHFATKDHVLVAYWDAFNARLLDDFDRIRKRTARTRLLAAMEISGNAAKSEPALGRVLLGRVFLSPALLESDQDNETRLLAWLERVLQDGIDGGELRADATERESLVFLIVASMSATFRDYILFGGDDPVTLMKRRMRLLLRTVEVSK